MRSVCLEVNKMLRNTIVPVNGENEKNLISFIASTVEAMRDQMATKADLQVLKDQMATKAELAAVKDDVAAVKNDVAAVKNDLVRVESQMATKNELERLETTMHGEFEQVHLRLDSIDRALSTRIDQVESEVSRLRSVLYWLVKDQPNILRLLGRPFPNEGHSPG